MFPLKLRRPLVLLGLLALVVSGCARDPEQVKRDYVASGDRFMTAKQPREAIVQYRNALQQDPQFGEARLKLSLAYESAGDARNAYRETVRAADLLPNDLALQVKAANLLLATGQFEDARTRAKNVLKKDPRNAQAQIVLGNATAGLKEFDTAVKQLEDAVALDPSSATAQAALGSVYLSQGQKPAAEQAFRAAVAAAPDAASPRMALANYLWAANRKDEARDLLEQAVKLEPANMLARRALVTFYMIQGRPLEAEPHFRVLADADKSPGQTTKAALADFYVATNRTADAERILEELATTAPTAAAARTRRAVLAYGRDAKSRAAAHAEIDEVLKADPKNVLANLVKGRFLLRENQLDAALVHATAAANADQTSIQAHYLIGTIQAARRDRVEAIRAFNQVLQLNPRAGAAQLQLARLTLQQGEADKALQFAQDAAKSAPRDANVFLLTARGYLAKGEAAKAVAALKPVAERYPDVAAFSAALGTAQLGARANAAARQAYEKAIAVDPTNAEAFAGLTLLDMMERRPQDARARADQHVAAFPNDVPGLMTAARVFNETGAPERAEQVLKKAIEIDPRNLQAYGMLGQYYAVHNRLEQARAVFEEVTAKRPNDIGAHTMVATLYEMEGKKAEARQRYERIIQIDRTAPVAANNLAYMYAEDGGNLDVALQLAQAAKLGMPNTAEVTDTVGWVYYKKGMATLAVPLLEEAVAQKPAQPAIRLHLAQAYAAAGKPDLAREQYERIVSGTPNVPEAAVAKTALGR